MQKRKQKRMTVAIVVAAIVLLAAALALFLYMTRDLVIGVQSTEAAKIPGETVTVAVVIGDNPGFTDAKWYVDYDRTRLELVSINDHYTNSDGKKIKYLPGAVQESGVEELDGVEYGYLKTSFGEVFKNENAILCSMTFHILDEASVGVADVWVFKPEVGCKNAAGTVRNVGATAIEGGILVGENQCNHVDDDKDTWCDDCKRQIAAVEQFEIAYSDMTLGNDLEVNFLIKRSDVNAITKFLTAHVTIQGAKGDTVQKIAKSQWEWYDIYYKISIKVKASQMTDNLVLEVKDKDGYVYNTPYFTTVRDYAQSVLEKPDTEELLKVMLVDMLNYGAAAQSYFNYRADDLANSILTEQMQSLASAPVVCRDIRVEGPAYVGSVLTIEEQIRLTVIFEGLDGEIRKSKYAEISFTDALGNEKFFTIRGEDFVPRGTHGYGVVVDQLALIDTRVPVTVTVKNADGSVYGSITDSVEGYISRMDVGSETEVYANTMKYSVSAYNYLKSRKA